MKRILCFLICILLCVSFTACSYYDANIRSPISFYYRTQAIEYNEADGVIRPEIRESFGHEEDYIYLVTQYLNGPVSSECISPFPAGTTLEELDFLKDKVLITLSSHISLLSGPELSVACTCLSKTVLEMTGKEEVRIRSKGSLIDGKEYISIALDDIVLFDDQLITPQR